MVSDKRNPYYVPPIQLFFLVTEIRTNHGPMIGAEVHPSGVRKILASERDGGLFNCILGADRGKEIFTRGGERAVGEIHPPITGKILGF